MPITPVSYGTWMEERGELKKLPAIAIDFGFKQHARPASSGYGEAGFEGGHHIGDLFTCNCIDRITARAHQVEKLILILEAPLSWAFGKCGSCPVGRFQREIDANKRWFQPVGALVAQGAASLLHALNEGLMRDESKCNILILEGCAFQGPTSEINAEAARAHYHDATALLKKVRAGGAAEPWVPNVTVSLARSIANLMAVDLAPAVIYVDKPFIRKPRRPSGKGAKPPKPPRGTAAAASGAASEVGGKPCPAGCKKKFRQWPLGADAHARAMKESTKCTGIPESITDSEKRWSWYRDKFLRR